MFEVNEMGQSWSGLRKELEENFICDSLRGRVKYFLTHYHGAPDKYGRVCIRVDGKEVVHGNPYDFYVKGYNLEEWRIKKKFNIPYREYSDKSYFLYDEENRTIEDMVREMAYKDGVFEIYDFTNAIFKYKNSNVIDSINSKNMLVRMLAIMDRRIGKRTLLKLVGEVEKQPDWLAFFYKLRLDAEGITY
jgi:hypothetical protein